MGVQGWIPDPTDRKLAYEFHDPWKLAGRVQIGSIRLPGTLTFDPGAARIAFRPKFLGRAWIVFNEVTEVRLRGTHGSARSIWFVAPDGRFDDVWFWFSPWPTLVRALAEDGWPVADEALQAATSHR
ncbi:MAG: hypothetical protein ACTHN0_16490 [Aquihabitans sp.]